MKMKNVAKKWLACLLTGSVVLAGCAAQGGGKASSGAGQTENQNEMDVQTSAQETREDQVNQEREVLKLFVDETWWSYDSWSGRIPELLSERLGVDFEVTIAADDTELNLMIASGELGDLVCTGKFGRMSDANVSYSLDELAGRAGEELDIHSVMRFVNTAEDGQIYTLMAGFSPRSYLQQWDKAVYEAAGMVVRSDIYEEMGSPDIKNLDDLERLLQMVKEKYPDMIPLIFNATHQNAFLKLLCGATVNTDGFIDIEGKAAPFIKDPNFKKYFELMNDWYRKGYMSDENFAFTSDDNDLEYIISNKAFADSRYSDTADVFNSKLKDAGCDFTVTQLIDITYMDGAKFTQGTAGWRGLFVPKSCKNPELAYKVLKYLWSPEGQQLMLWGEEGKDWEWSEDRTYPILNYDFDNPSQEGRADGLKFWGWMYHDGAMAALPGFASGGATYPARRALTDISETNPVLGTLRLGADSEEQTIMKNLTELFKMKAVEIITAPSKEEASALYEEMLQTAEELGAHKLEAWAAERYESKKAEYDRIKDNEE